jgi:glutaconate CoA-transferase subunit B
MMIPNIILFHDVHRKRALVRQVGFISATGVSPANVYRPGGPTALVTDMGRFSFDRETARFTLESVHPGHSAQDIIENTGFSFDRASGLLETTMPDAPTLDMIGGPIADEMAEIYPRFALELAASAAQPRR